MNDTELKSFIDKNVDGQKYIKDRLFNYLKIHDIVSLEVFDYCTKNGKYQGLGYRDDLTEKWKLEKDSFIRRIPFYFYGESLSDSPDEYAGVGDLFPRFEVYTSRDERDAAIKAFYEGLEFIFYEMKIPVSKMCNYCVDQAGYYNHYFNEWVHYLHLCRELGWANYYPDRFITAYNEALAASGLQPVIYEVDYCPENEFFRRYNDTIELWGAFPCDPDGNPIMKWIGVSAVNVASITSNCKKSKITSQLYIKLKPDSIVKLLNVYNSADDTEDYWYTIYTGPKYMNFNPVAIKERRKELKLTQKEVADAVDANVRTYQKWENGETEPDGHYLLRLLNWLDIKDLQEVVKYK